MNNITIIGNLTKAPELRSTQDGTPVCGFTVAVNRKKTQNNPDPGADFFNVNAWRGLGESCAKYLDKGRKVAVHGRISLRTWEKDGKHGASLEILAEDVEFLSPRGQTSADGGYVGQDSGYSGGQGYAQAEEPQQVEADDLPF